MNVCALGILLALSLLADRAEPAGTCEAKKRGDQQLISNGSTIRAGAWPWYGVMFYHVGRSMPRACGVTILTEQFVITAAYCTFVIGEMKHIPEDRIFIRVGVTNLDETDRPVQQHNVHRIIRHEGFDKSTFEDDIALVKLYTAIEYNEYVQPICLWQGAAKLSDLGYIVGWGLDESFELSKDLIEASVSIVSKKECIDSDSGYLGSKTFCGGYGTQVALGVGGGGLYSRVGQNWVLRGIASTSMMTTKNYAIFTDVAHYLNWIRSHVAVANSLEIDAVAENSNLLNISSCGRDLYPPGTPEQTKGYLNQYPWLAVIEYVNAATTLLEDGCHGVVIHPSFLVTTAHCVGNRRLSSLHSVRLNDYRLDTTTDIFKINGKITRATATRIPIWGISQHPNYGNPRFASNIALIKLERPTSVNPICLPPKESNLLVDKKFTIIGWKKSSRKEKPIIRKVAQLTDFSVCRSKYAAKNVLLDLDGGYMCSIYSHADDNETCSHYMGSAPVYYVQNDEFEGRYFLAAISSFGHSNCRRDEYLDVFSNVAHYAEWIQEKVKNNE